MEVMGPAALQAPCWLLTELKVTATSSFGSAAFAASRVGTKEQIVCEIRTMDRYCSWTVSSNVMFAGAIWLKDRRSCACGNVAA